MKILDKIPYPIIIAIAIFMSLAPLTGEPHLIEKWRMLAAFTLTKPIDIFDIIIHTAPIVIVLLKIVRTMRLNNKN